MKHHQEALRQKKLLSICRRVCFDWPQAAQVFSNISTGRGEAMACLIMSNPYDLEPLRLPCSACFNLRFSYILLIESLNAVALQLYPYQVFHFPPSVCNWVI